MAKDLFSDQAGEYALYRPVYPQELFDYILSFVSEKGKAWDVATGNGQAAIPLTGHFKKVIGSDISKLQLEQAVQEEHLEYVHCAAEETPFAADTWQAFHKEACRVGKKGCVIAVWMYHLPQSSEGQINEAVQHFYTHITGPYWDPERKHIDEFYKNVLFDFERLPSKDFTISKEFTKDELAGYFSSWSATRHYIKANGHSPIPVIREALDKAWRNENPKPFTFRIHLRLGRIEK